MKLSRKRLSRTLVVALSRYSPPSPVPSSPSKPVPPRSWKPPRAHGRTELDDMKLVDARPLAIGAPALDKAAWRPSPRSNFGRRRRDV